MGVVTTPPKSACTYKESGTKVAVFTCSLDATQTETKGTVLLHDAKELMNYNQSEEDFIHNVVKGLHEMGVGVVIVGEKVSEMALHYIDKYNMVCLKLVSKWTLRRLCRAVRARPVVTLTDIISKLYKAHSEDTKEAKRVGVDIVNGGVKDMTKEGVIDLMATRQMGLKLATQSAATILRVDHIIMKKPAGGPKKPNRGHWDDNDETW